MRGQLSRNNVASDVEKARFCTKFSLLIDCAKFCLHPEPEPEAEPEPQKIITVPQHCSLKACFFPFSYCF